MKIKVLDQLKNIDVMAVLEETGAILEGHFKLSSGLHSGNYLQCAKLLQYPDRTAKLVDAALKQYHGVLNSDSVDTVVSPAIGGLFFGYMLACRLRAKMVFTERKEGRMELCVSGSQPGRHPCWRNHGNSGRECDDFQSGKHSSGF